MTPEDVAEEVRRIELATRRLVRDLVAGDYASTFRGRGMEFADVRAYHAGDDVRTIDWRVTARLGQTYIRQYQEERELTLLLAVDVSASGQVGSRLRTKRELAAQVAGVLALAAARSNDRVGVMLFTDRVEHVVRPRKGRAHALRVVSDILSFEPRGRGTDLVVALDYLEPMLPRRTALFVLSDFDCPGYHLPLARLARQHDVVAVQLVERLEHALPAVGLVELWDPESGESRVVDAGSEVVREHIRRERLALEAIVAREVTAAGADLVRLDASQPYAEPLIGFFRRRARGRGA